jgi:hypothetical protein
VSLSRSQLADLLGVLDKIDAGAILPRVGDRIGRFLRQYQSGRRDVCAVLAQQCIACRADGAVSGRSLGAIEMHSLIEPEVDVLAFPLGETASALAMSEELGGIVKVRMWLKAATAHTAFDVLNQTSTLRLVGDYRWTPLAQLTPGEAQTEAADHSLSWRDARCLKIVADDLLRPPHAVEYVIDYRVGPPGLKCFRTMCATREGDLWRVLPCFGESKIFKVGAIATTDDIPGGELLLLLAYREPWSNDWTIVRAATIQPAEALSHAITWAHFRSELAAEVFGATAVTAARESLRAWGVTTHDLRDLNLSQHLLPAAKTLLRSVRGAG